IVMVMDIQDAVYTNLTSSSIMTSLSGQGMTARELIREYKNGSRMVTLNGTDMDIIYVNGEGVQELNRESFSVIGEYLSGQTAGRTDAAIVMLEARGYPFYDSIRDGMYIYQMGGTLYMWIPVGI